MSVTLIQRNKGYVMCANKKRSRAAILGSALLSTEDIKTGQNKKK